MDVFDEKAYVAEILIPAAERFRDDGSLPDVFSRYGLALDVGDVRIIGSRVERVSACWHRMQADPVCDRLLGVLLDLEEQRRARRILVDPRRRAAERAAIEWASAVVVPPEDASIDPCASVEEGGAPHDRNETVKVAPTENGGGSSPHEPRVIPVVAPEPVPSVTLTMRDDGVLVEWGRSATNGDLTYEVNRVTLGSEREGDGVVLSFTSLLSYLDSDVRAGERYDYRVTAMCDEVRADFTRAPGSLFFMREVSACAITAESRLVRASWSVPRGATRVLVHRYEDGPSGTAATWVDAPWHLHGFEDDQVSNGVAYTYRIQVEYDDPQGPQLSEGITVTARPEAPPDPVERLFADLQEREVVLSWAPAPAGEVRIYRTVSEPRWSFGALVSLGEVGQLSSPLESREGASAVDRAPHHGVVFYVPTTMVGARVAVGRALCFTHLEDARELEVDDFGGYLQLRWRWPSSCSRARVSWRSDRFPADCDDPAATHVDVSRVEYENRGGFRLSQPDSVPYWFTVYTAAVAGPDVLFSAGVHDGCRRSCVRGETTRVSYHIKRPLFGCRLTVRFDASAPVACPEVLVVAKPGSVQPLTREDGRTVGRCNGIDGRKPSSEWPLDLIAVGSPSYLRAFFSHDDDYRRFSLVDPPVRELLYR